MINHIAIGLFVGMFLWLVGFLTVYYNQQILCWIKWNKHLPFNLRWKITNYWVEAVKAGWARLHRKMIVKQLSSFPAGENPFLA